MARTGSFLANVTILVAPLARKADASATDFVKRTVGVAEVAEVGFGILVGAATINVTYRRGRLVLHGWDSLTQI